MLVSLFYSLSKKNDTYEILRELTDINMYNYEQKNENDLRNLFLVDHYETTHKVEIIGCIDHHPTEKENTYKFSYVKNSSATAYLIYELMKVTNYPLTAKEFNLDYEYLEKYCLCLTPIKKMNIDQITSNGQKKYSYNGHKVASAYLQLYGMPDKATLNRWITYLSSKIIKKTSDTEMTVFIIFDTKSNITYEYQIMKYYVKKIIHEGILSRGKDINPKLKKDTAMKPKLKNKLKLL